MFKALLSVTALVAALSACGAPQSSAPVAPAPTTEGGRLMATTGRNVAEDNRKIGYAGKTNLVNAGQAVGMAQSFGGAGLGLGVVNWLTADTGPVDPILYAQLSKGASPTAFSEKVNTTAYKMLGRDYEAAGYHRVAPPKAPFTARVYVKDGCGLTRHGWYDHDCSETFDVLLFPVGQDATNQTFVVGYPGYVGKNFTQIQLKLAQAFPKELFLYIPATKSEPPRVFKAGKYLPIE